jgi:hypothetical protein
MQQAAFASGTMDLGYPIYSVSMSSGTSTGSALIVVEEGEPISEDVIAFLDRTLDSENKDDNCIKCLARNENIK